MITLERFGNAGRVLSRFMAAPPSATKRKWTRALEIAALSLVLLNGVGYFAVLRPLESHVEVERNRRTWLRLDLVKEQRRVSILQQYVSELPAADAQVGQFVGKHITPRQRAFSTADTLVAKLSQKTGIELTGVSYKPETTNKNPLQWIRIDLEAEGAFNNLMDFLQQLQADDDFALIRSFGLDAKDKGKLSLHLGADLYLTP
jgi:hypothetical protein